MLVTNKSLKNSTKEIVIHFEDNSALKWRTAILADMGIEVPLNGKTYLTFVLLSLLLMF